MPQSLLKRVIIAALLLGSLVGLAGCSALRLAYNNGPLVAWWWLDGYVDFSSEQAPRAKAALGQWFDWARQGQLPELASALVLAQAEVMDNTTPAQACRWQALLRDKLDPALERGLLLAADLVPGLGEMQWRHLEQRFAKKNEEWRGDFLQPRPDERQKASVQRTVERAEMLYGDVRGPALKAIEAGVQASPFDPVAWSGERERRQRDTVQTLRRLSAERADRDRIVAALRVLVERVERSPDPAYRGYQVKLAEYNCEFAARVHNATTPAQRQRAREQLKTWEDDLRALAAGQ